MKIVITAIGSRGDVQPFVALGGGLRRAGHDVRILTHEIYGDLAASLGLDLLPLSGDIRGIIASAPKESDPLLRRGPIAMYRENQRNARAMAASWMREVLEGCRTADAVIVTGNSFFLGVPVAERLRLPYVQAYTSPAAPTRAFPPPFLVRRRWPRAGIGNLARHLALRQMAWQSFRSAVNAARREVLGLPAWPMRGPWKDLERNRAWVLYAYSTLVVPRPDDWGPHHEIVGYWFLDRSREWRPPAALEEFIAAGPPPIFIGFGNSVPPHRGRTDLIIAALQQAGRRAVLASTREPLGRDRLPDTIFPLADADAPLDWLLPQMAAIMHHGGAGTAAAGLRAGIPAVTMPFLSDQHFWALRLSELGVAALPLRYRELTPGGLAAAVERVVNDATMLRRAVALGAAIRAEDGIGRAVARIEILMARQRSVAGLPRPIPA
jgi:sterol 3beta-glucosyltransferase